jgi:hypothetical protein
MPRNRLAPRYILTFSLALLSCTEQQTFQDPAERDLEIIDFERDRLEGGGMKVIRDIEVTPEMGHPEFLGRWSNLKLDINVDFYVMRQEYFDDKVTDSSDLKDLVRCKPIPPDSVASDPYRDCLFWSSVPEGGPCFKDCVTKMHLHPPPGRWVMLFHNPNAPNQTATEAEISGKLWIRWQE